jgi:hypothetical protein
MGKAERVTTARHRMDGSSGQGNRKQSCGELRQHISPFSFVYIFVRTATCYAKRRTHAWRTLWPIPLNRARTMRHAPMRGSKNFMGARVLPVFLVGGVNTFSTMLQTSRRRVRGN